MKTLERIPLFTALAALAYACSADHGPVGPVPPPPFRVVSLVKITPATLDTLFFRDTVRLTAVALDQRGSPIADAAIRWSSSSEAGWFFKDGGLSPTATGSSVLVYPYLDGSSVIQASVGATFATLVLNAKAHGTPLRIIASRHVPWQNKTAASLSSLSPALDVDLR